MSLSTLLNIMFVLAVVTPAATSVTETDAASVGSGTLLTPGSEFTGASEGAYGEPGLSLGGEVSLQKNLVLTERMIEILRMLDLTVEDYLNFDPSARIHDDGKSLRGNVGDGITRKFLSNKINQRFRVRRMLPKTLYQQHRQMAYIQAQLQQQQAQLLERLREWYQGQLTDPDVGLD